MGPGWEICLGLFFAAFLAATLIPAQSEAALGGLVAAWPESFWLLIGFAAAGNILGSVINWVLGLYAQKLKGRKWFPITEKTLERGGRWYGRYGRWSLLLAWVPVIGDPLTAAAGFLREPLWSFLVLVAVGKIARYLVVAQAALKIAGG